MWTIYATSTCSFCKQAKEFLEERGEKVKYILLTHHTLNEYLDAFPNAKTVPQIITPEGRKIGGFDNLVQLFK